MTTDEPHAKSKKKKKKKKSIFSLLIIITVTCMGVYTRGLDWWMDLLTTYTHDSELQAITELSLIYSLFKSRHAKSSPVLNVFTSRCLVTNLNNGDSSASVVTPLLSDKYPATELST
jgi:hypothetical protein